MLESLGGVSTGTRAFRHSGVIERSQMTITYLVDIEEHESRKARGVHAVSDEFLLAGLISVPIEGLGPVGDRFAKLFRSPATAQVAAVIDDPDGRVWAQRILGVPVELVEIEISATTWRRGCAAAHRWAGYGRRMVRTDATLNNFELTEAAHYGIGIISSQGTRTLEPGPFLPERWSSARWRMAELVYSQFLDLQG